jgi:hypothetical protein
MRQAHKLTFLFEAFFVGCFFSALTFTSGSFFCFFLAGSTLLDAVETPKLFLANAA